MVKISKIQQARDEIKRLEGVASDQNKELVALEKAVSGELHIRGMRETTIEGLETEALALRFEIAEHKGARETDKLLSIKQLSDWEKDFVALRKELNEAEAYSGRMADKLAIRSSQLNIALTKTSELDGEIKAYRELLRLPERA